MGKWLSKFLSKHEEEVSFGHVLCLLVICYIMVMSTLFILKAAVFPTSLPDIPQGWVYVVGLFWGIPKVAEAISNRKGAEQ